MEKFLALILPLDATSLPHPDHTLPGPQPQPPQPPHPGHDLPLFPFHPIVIPPGGIWPDQPNVPTHPIVLPPGLPPYPDHTLPGDLPHPDHTLPGPQPRPDHDLPPFPSHPIVYPPGFPGVPPTPGVPPIIPEHPIVLPPDEAPSGAVIIKVPEAEVPADFPPGTVAGLVWYGPGTYPVAVYVTPRAQPK